MSASPQPEINIGMVGHVDHGKTTLTQALTGKWTDQHSEEMKRGISIKLGYADADFYKIKLKNGEEHYTSEPNKNIFKGGKKERIRTVSFVDAPGHETLMAVMLSGAAIMDAAILIIAANEKCPQPQTREHLSALEIMGFEKFIIVQSKIDVCSKERAQESYKEIKEFLKGSLLENAPIIPVSAHHGRNVDLLIQVINDMFPTPEKDLGNEFRMNIARSFDINKPGTKPAKIQGGILGGTVSKGKIKIDDELEIRPGRTKNIQDVEELKTKEPLMITVGTRTTVGMPITVKENIVDINLTIPVCAPVGQRIALSRRVDGKWHLIGYGIIKK